jgi:hypothetical protein
MHGPINLKSPNNINEWQTGFNSAFKGLSSVSAKWRTTFKNSATLIFLFRILLYRQEVNVFYSFPKSRFAIMEKNKIPLKQNLWKLKCAFVPPASKRQPNCHSSAKYIFENCCTQRKCSSGISWASWHGLWCAQIHCLNCRLAYYVIYVLWCLRQSLCELTARYKCNITFMWPYIVLNFL